MRALGRGTRCDALPRLHAPILPARRHIRGRSCPASCWHRIPEREAPEQTHTRAAASALRMHAAAYGRPAQSGVLRRTLLQYTRSQCERARSRAVPASPAVVCARRRLLEPLLLQHVLGRVPCEFLKAGLRTSGDAGLRWRAVTFTATLDSFGGAPLRCGEASRGPCVASEADRQELLAGRYRVGRGCLHAPPMAEMTYTADRHVREQSGQFAVRREPEAPR